MAPAKKKIKTDHPQVKAKSDHPAKGGLRIPARSKIGELSYLKADYIRDDVKKWEITFDHNATQPKLQAIWCLSFLRLVGKGDTPNKAMVDTVIKWIGKKNSVLVRALRKNDVTIEGGKWDYIEALILDQSVPPPHSLLYKYRF
jgi:hypothetical protein